jgi:hypothetical protein
VRRSVVVVILAVVLAAGCSDDDGGGAAATTLAPASSTTSAPAGPSPVVEATCAGALPGATASRVRAGQLREASGLAASGAQPDVFWAHNDSGDTARVFAIGTDGARLGTFRLGPTEDGVEASAVDWEDMAIDGDGRLYLGDIGDNAAQRGHITIHRLPEPALEGGGPVNETSVEVTYPDGPRDAEALLIDPLGESFVIIEKSLSGGPVGVYAGPLAWPAPDDPGLVTLERIGTYALPDGPEFAVTAADLSVDGRTLAVRTYGHIWDREDGATVADTLGREPCEAPIPAEVQGEAIAVLPEAAGFATIPESVGVGAVRLNLVSVPRQ